jgi:hypothetical protein
MKNTFGDVKSKILKKMTDLYEKNNKNEIKEILSIINENNDFKKLYTFYEDVEKMELSYPGSAELYVETIQPLLIEQSKKIEKTYKKLEKYLKNVECETDELYKNLDVLSESVSLNNMDKKVLAKRKLIEHLSTKKEIVEFKNDKHVGNEKLLMTLLSNDFNSYFGRTLSEEDKTKLKNILSLSNEEIQTKTRDLSEEILTSINGILAESQDDELKKKLNQVKLEVMYTKPTKYNYFKLLEFKNGLV